MTQDVKAQHTPGPWRECRDGDCTCGFIWSADGEIHVATVHGPDALGQDWYGSDVATDRVDMARAALEEAGNGRG